MGFHLLVDLVVIGGVQRQPQLLGLPGQHHIGKGLLHDHIPVLLDLGFLRGSLHAVIGHVRDEVFIRILDIPYGGHLIPQLNGGQIGRDILLGFIGRGAGSFCRGRSFFFLIVLLIAGGQAKQHPKGQPQGQQAFVHLHGIVSFLSRSGLLPEIALH